MALEITSPWLPIHFGYILSGLFMLLITVIGYIAHDEKPYAGFRMFGTEPGDLVNSRAKERFVKNGISIMKRGLQEVVASGGPMLILPPSFVDEIRNDNRLSFPGAIERDWFPTYPGLEAVQALRHNIFQDMVKKNLMTSVALDDEMDKVTEEMFPASKEWSELRFSPLSLQVVARLTARVFLGEPLCRNKEWIDLSIRYTIDAYLAAKTLRSWPPYLRPFVYRFLPELRVVRDQFQKARQIIEPEIAARRHARHQALLEGKPRPKSNDALSWFDDCAGDRPYDVTQGQMLLTIVSIHTTSSTLLALMYDIVGHSEYIDMLREEITQVLKEEKGLTKTSLHRMKLLDSCMKESQRLHPTGSGQF
ncbi:hypothetical protein SLS56_003240 [Neofusicoccum ribis]|uniref:Cytochrome P450 monooxygenase n=1 Tax=Neofusicoccum ribis TaxID=45134 RepID=A0ABR3T050_9PEZI